MKTLKDSLVYCTLVKTPALTRSLKSINFEVDSISLNAIEEPLQTMTRRLNYPTKMSIIKLLQEGRVRIIYNPSTVRIPKYMDVFGKIHMGKPIFGVNITRYGRGKSDDVNINPRTLFALLQTALINSAMLEKWDVVVNHDIVKKSGSLKSHFVA